MQTCWLESSLQRSRVLKQARARQAQARALSMLARRCPQREHPSDLVVRHSNPDRMSVGCESFLRYSGSRELLITNTPAAGQQ